MACGQSCVTHRDGVFPRMPARMQNLLVEVQRFQRHVLPHSTRPPILHPCLVARQRATNLLRLERRLIGLQYNVVEGICVIYPEVIVV